MTFEELQNIILSVDISVPSLCFYLAVKLTLTTEIDAQALQHYIIKLS